MVTFNLVMGKVRHVITRIFINIDIP